MAAINQQTEPAGGWSGAVLKRIGYLLLTAGVLGRAVFENGLLDIRQYDNAALLAALHGSGQVMQLATLAIVLQGIGLCAVPLFTFALVEGMRHTANVRRYGLRVALLALASEIPYNLAFEGRWWAPDTRSPAAGLLLALLMLWLMDHYGKGENRWKSGLLQAVILAAAVLWALLLRVDHGVVIVALAAVLLGRKKPAETEETETSETAEVTTDETEKAETVEKTETEEAPETPAAPETETEAPAEAEGETKTEEDE